MRWCISIVLLLQQITKNDRSSIWTLVFVMVTACLLLLFFLRFFTLTLQSSIRVRYRQCVKRQLLFVSVHHHHHLLFLLCWFNRPITSKCYSHALIVWEDIDLCFDCIKQRKYEPTNKWFQYTSSITFFITSFNIL